MKNFTPRYRTLATLCMSLSILATPLAGCDKGDPATELLEDRPEFSGTSDGPVLIRYKFEPGEMTEMAFSANVEMEGEVMGMELDMAMLMEMEANYVIQSVNADGDATAIMTITAMKMSMEMPAITGGGDMSFDSANPSASSPEFQPMMAMLNLPITVRTSMRGELLEGDFYPMLEALGGAGLPDISSVEQFTSQLMDSSFVQLPENPVSPGDVYDAGTFTLAGGGGGGAQNPGMQDPGAQNPGPQNQDDVILDEPVVPTEPEPASDGAQSAPTTF